MTGAGKAALVLSFAVHAAVAGALSATAVRVRPRPGPSRVEVQFTAQEPSPEPLPEEPEPARILEVPPPSLPPPTPQVEPPEISDPRFAYDAEEPGPVPGAAGDPGIVGIGRGGPILPRPAIPPPPAPPVAAPRPAAPPPAPAGASRRAFPLEGACPGPGYPERERRQAVEGLVELRVAVAADGAVASVEVARSSGSPALDRAALAAVRAWRFEPALLDGSPVADAVLVPVRFVLR